MHPAGKTVLITGASSGIGAASARAFAAAGAKVILAARDQAKLEALARELPGQSLVVPTDVSDRQAIVRLAQAAATAFGGIDILINNAGVGLAGPVAELSEDDFQQALAVDLFGPLALTQAVLPGMRARGHGQIIFVSSVVGLRSLPYLGGYAAAKAALDRLSEALRVELRGSGVAVTLVRPGTTDTGFASRRLGQGRERRRMQAGAATPAQVAQVIVKAAIREPRVAYVTLADRLRIGVSLCLPGITDWLLGRAFSWERPTEEKTNSA